MIKRKRKRLSRRDTARMSDADTFWYYMDRPSRTACWRWHGRTDADGIPVYKGRGGTHSGRARRVAWLFMYPNMALRGGQTPVRQCGTELCCNPQHHKLGIINCPRVGWSDQNIQDELLSRLEKYTPRGSAKQCWEYTGPRKSSGYGLVRIKSREFGTLIVPAHRLAMFVKQGPIPRGLIVRHTCDNPPCVNPGHLVLGTFADNTQDAVLRNRFRPRRHEQSGASKLTWEVVRQVRKRYIAGYKMREIAEFSRVTCANIGAILRGQTWFPVLGDIKRCEGRDYALMVKAAAAYKARKRDLRKLSPKDVMALRAAFDRGDTRKELAKQFNVGLATIWKVGSRFSHRDVP